MYTPRDNGGKKLLYVYNEKQLRRKLLKNSLTQSKNSSPKMLVNKIIHTLSNKYMKKRTKKKKERNWKEPTG